MAMIDKSFTRKGRLYSIHIDDGLLNDPICEEVLENAKNDMIRRDREERKPKEPRIRVMSDPWRFWKTSHCRNCGKEMAPVDMTESLECSVSCGMALDRYDDLAAAGLDRPRGQGMNMFLKGPIPKRKTYVGRAWFNLHGFKYEVQVFSLGVLEFRIMCETEAEAKRQSCRSNTDRVRKEIAQGMHE